MYTYKEFSKIMNTTIRTLRFYEEKGLITPKIINNIKCLNDEDLLKFQTINLLKDANYSLIEIKKILKEHNLQEQIIMQKEILNMQLINTQSMIDLIEKLEKNPNISPLEICQNFNKIKNTKNLQLQFNDPEHLLLRIDFHHRYTTFKDNFQQWLFNHYHFQAKDKVLEIGCGTGTLWLENKDKIPKDIEIILSDVSKEMIKTSKENLSGFSMIKKFLIADCYQLPFADNSFDIVIINHVLMYLEDVDNALKEIHRILKKGGRIYCSTIARDMMKDRDDLITKFDPRISYNQSILYQRFGYENGKEKLEKYFKQVKIFDRKEIYKIDNVYDYYHFILSGNGLGNQLHYLFKKKEEFFNYMVKEFKKKNYFDLTIHAGMFEAKKEE